VSLACAISGVANPRSSAAVGARRVAQSSAVFFVFGGLYTEMSAHSSRSHSPRRAAPALMLIRATYVVGIEMRELHTTCELPRLCAFAEASLRIAPSCASGLPSTPCVPAGQSACTSFLWAHNTFLLELCD
jgi:hypothetical protein